MYPIQKIYYPKHFPSICDFNPEILKTKILDPPNLSQYNELAVKCPYAPVQVA